MAVHFSRRHILLAPLAAAGCATSTGAPMAIATSWRVAVDHGASLYLEIRGRRADAPLLIWLHGGPGGAERPLFRLYNAELESRFVVVYLDQRGAGRSFDPRADPSRLTIAQHVADLDRVIDDLRRRLGGRQAILLGHSWGSGLGLIYAQAHPEKVAACIGVGQVTSEAARQASQYAFALDQARRRGDAEALRRIAAIGPPPFSAARGLAIQRFVERYGGYWRGRPHLEVVALRAWMAGIASPWEIPRLIEANTVSLEAMQGEIGALDLPRRAPGLAVPVAFFLGRYDRQVDSRLAAAYFDALQAPAKRLVWFETAHNIPFEAPAEFNAAVPRVLADLGVIRSGAEA